MNNFAAAAILKRNYLFKGLNESIIAQIAAVGTRCVFRKGELIFMQGDAGDALYAVMSGRVRISSMNAEGREVFLNIMETGDSFGEIAAVDGLARTAGATAMTPTVLLAIWRDNLLDLLEREPRLAIHLLQFFCERVRWTSQLYEESTFLTARARLAKRLVMLATLHGSRSANAPELRISQSELAQFLGISRQIVNQYLQDWRKAGWIDVSRLRLTIRNLAALQAQTTEPGTAAHHPAGAGVDGSSRSAAGALPALG